jgi:hypothetical protein
MDRQKAAKQCALPSLKGGVNKKKIDIVYFKWVGRQLQTNNILFSTQSGN